MGFMLGNKTISDIEKDHGFSFTDDERDILQKYWHPVADFKDGECGWHMFDLPPFLEISNGEIGKKCLDVFMKHNSDFKFQFRGGYGNGYERKDGESDGRTD